MDAAAPRKTPVVTRELEKEQGMYLTYLCRKLRRSARQAIVVAAGLERLWREWGLAVLPDNPGPTLAAR
jgi:hypothetical protein